jgi:hypothetical protein
VADAITARFKPCAVPFCAAPATMAADGFVGGRGLLDESGFIVRVAHDAEPASPMRAAQMGEVAVAPTRCEGRRG